MTASPRQEPDATAPKARSAKKFWWLGGALATVVVVVTAAIVVPTLFDSRGGQFEQVLEGECAPLAVLAFRGSGEGKTKQCRNALPCPALDRFSQVG